MQVTFTAKWNRDIYRTDEYVIAIYYDADSDTSYKCVGKGLPAIKNIKYHITAECKPDEKYGGNKYEIIAINPAPCESESDIIEYLSSGIFHGIGKKTAERIYQKYHESAIDIIENHPEELSKIKGVSYKKALEISNKCKASQAEVEIYKYLSRFGFTTKQAHQAKMLAPTQEYLEYIKSNPYEMIAIRGVTFEMADMVASDNLVPKDDMNRINAAAEQIIKNMMMQGHTGCEYLPLAKGLIRMLNTPKINAENVKCYILELIKRDKLAYRKVKTDQGKEIFYIYLHSAYDAERELAEMIRKNVERGRDKEIKSLDSLILRAAGKNNVNLDKSQIEAVRTALANNLSVITGGPGTGKTTIIKILASIWEETIKTPVVLMSPTGRAARRITESTGRKAATIHSTLRFGLCDESGLRKEMSEDNSIENSLVVIDECSMIDVFLARDMMSLLKNCTVVLVGDSDQLPSVGCGKVLEDIILSERIPVVELKFSHRQNEGSTICKNADLIKNGDYKLKAAPDFVIKIKQNSKNECDSDIFDALENVMISEYKKLVNEYGVENVAVLCPFNKHKAGQLSMNSRLQEIINPYNGSREFKGKNGQIFRRGDPVMHLVNDEDVSNGDIGTVITIDNVDGIETLVVQYYDRMKAYTKETSDTIALAYAMTVHKSQGSEYDAIITCLADAHRSMVKRNILYTAITRAKKKVVFCGTETAMKSAILNNKTEKRNTLLWYDIREKIQKKNKIVPIQGEYIQQTMQINRR